MPNRAQTIVRSTYGVTFDNALELMPHIRCYAVPTVLEISSLDAVMPGFYSYLLPLVLNLGNPGWIFPSTYRD
ncbi:geranylgeranylglyceryl/heptaprenylglyceryl phosphate synthase [Brevibacillus gelatini]|uniref:geranylgeranylglyceryl/heptaprenylglyceryl phosphate synthase n=1 Tax=Brevibacillus gelatini TaxID=1655277 RepID=UPI001FE6DC2C|nr:geranylgeranylglyceryl/heptaprenylglyceryl phosphate synthase [Brevibacillus gelatini]